MKPSRACKRGMLAVLFASLAMLLPSGAVASTAEVNALVTSANAALGIHIERSEIPSPGVVAVGHDFAIQNDAAGLDTALLYEQVLATADDLGSTISCVDGAICDPFLFHGNEELGVTPSAVTFRTVPQSGPANSTFVGGRPTTEAVTVAAPVAPVDSGVDTATEGSAVAPLQVGVVGNRVVINSENTQDLIVGSMPGTVLRTVETAATFSRVVIYANADGRLCRPQGAPASQTILGGQRFHLDDSANVVRTASPALVTLTGRATNVAPDLTSVVSVVFFTPSFTFTETPTTPGVGLGTRRLRRENLLPLGAHGLGLKTFQTGNLVRRSVLTPGSADIGEITKWWARA